MTSFSSLFNQTFMSVTLIGTGLSSYLPDINRCLSILFYLSSTRDAHERSLFHEISHWTIKDAAPRQVGKHFFAQHVALFLCDLALYALQEARASKIASPIKPGTPEDGLGNALA